MHSMSHRKHKTFPCSKIRKPVCLVFSSFYHICRQEGAKDLRNVNIYSYSIQCIYMCVFKTHNQGMFNWNAFYLFIHGFDDQDRWFMSFHM